MKHKSILLLCLLVGPALARPNMEPIYYRANSNPLEVTEELIPTTNALPLVASGGDSDHQTSTGASSGNNNPATQATPTVAPGTTTSPVSTSTTTPAPSTLAQDHISRYTKYADDVLSSESIIKDFIIKNLANFQQDKVGVSNYVPISSLTEEPNTLRSVSLAPVMQTSPNWDPPDTQFQYMNVRKKPIIHKIITKWSDTTQEAFNVDFNGQHGLVTPVHLLNNFGTTSGFYTFPTSTPGPVIIVQAKPVFTPEVANDQLEFSEDEYNPLPVQDEFPLDNVYQSQADPVDDVYSEPPKKKKKKKNKNKKKKPEKQQSDPDPDRPDANYWNDVEQVEPTGWQQQADPYGDDTPKDPYDDQGALKGEEVVENEEQQCNGIRITVNGKEACNEIEISINEPQRDEVTKSGSPLAPAAAAAAPVVAAAAVGASSLSAEPPAAAGASLASDAALFAAPAEPIGLSAVPVLPPLVPPAPLASFLSTPIGNLMGNIMPPTRVGTGSGTSGGGPNKNKKPHDSGDTGISSIIPDTSHALMGMMAAMSAMTPMNIIIMTMAALPVIAMVMASVGVGMYMYSKLTPPIKNFSQKTTTNLTDPSGSQVAAASSDTHPIRMVRLWKLLDATWIR